jgi:hypothetical protein
MRPLHRLVDAYMADSIRWYFDVLLAFEKVPGSIVFPVDLLGKLKPDNRIEEVRKVFDNYLNLDVDSKTIGVMQEWQLSPLSQPASYNHSLSFEKLLGGEREKAIREHIDETGILKRLNDLGIPYGETPEKPLAPFSFSKGLPSTTPLPCSLEGRFKKDCQMV